MYCQQQPPPGRWAELHWLATQTHQKLKIYLTKPSSHYGRRQISHQTGEEGFCFNGVSINDFDPLWISVDHFRIDKIEEDHNIAIIRVGSQSGVQLNDNLVLYRAQSAVLRHGDVIVIAGHPIFQFFYVGEQNYDPRDFPPQMTSKYLIGRTFSKGGQGSVRKIYLYGAFGYFSTMRFALKTICKVRDYDQNTQSHVKMLQHLDQEVDNMITLCIKGHLNIVRLFQSYATLDWNFIVMEFCETNLLDHIKSYGPPQALSEDDGKFIFYQICSGLKYIHSERIAHRDIKAENIFLSQVDVAGSKFWVAKIGDFGFSKKVDDHLNTQLGTDAFIPPEVLKRQDEYDLSADIWCLGCLLFVMLSGTFPFHENYMDYLGLSLSQQILNAKMTWMSMMWQNVNDSTYLLFL